MGINRYFIAIFAAAIASYFTLQHTQPHPPVRHRANDQPPYVRALMDNIPRYQAYHLGVLEAVGANDPETVELMSFYREHASYVGVIPTGRIFGRNEYVRGEKFGILVCSPNRRAEQNVPNDANWLYGVSERVVIVPEPEEFTAVWAGARFAHELSHARTYYLRGDQRTVGLARREFILEEVRAHRYEARLVDNWTHGRYLPRINAWLDNHMTNVRMNNPCLSEFEPSLIAAVQDLFPPSRGTLEDGTRYGSIMATANLIRMQRLGFSDSAAGQCLLSVGAVAPAQ